ncbi:hypothetical protein CASFOL_014654 [Castilleja foliolosa]|uniref:Uncharacterized protein n=1 Tax=Castilleja foliolosa TaxID=1961234 RepID=A0ABD3DFI7_9LAMI
MQAPANTSNFQSKNNEKAKPEVKVRLNLHGIVSVGSAM